MKEYEIFTTNMTVYSLTVQFTHNVALTFKSLKLYLTSLYKHKMIHKHQHHDYTINKAASFNFTR